MSRIPSSNCVRGKKGRMRELRSHLFQEACLEVQRLGEPPLLSLTHHTWRLGLGLSRCRGASFPGPGKGGGTGQ